MANTMSDHPGEGAASDVVGCRATIMVGSFRLACDQPKDHDGDHETKVRWA